MQLRIEKKKIVAEFEYTSVMYAIVMTIPSRRFDKKTKTWRFDIQQIVPIVETLVPLGFTYSEDIVKEYKSIKAIKMKLDKVKTGVLSDAQRALIDELRLPLYEYQKLGAAFLTIARNALLCDQPGLGKTLQTIATILLSKSEKSLVFCPKSVKQGWYEELAKWAPHLRAVVIDGTKKQREKLWRSDADVYIANYALIIHDYDILASIGWDFCACDEATVISNHENKTTKLIKKLSIPRKIAMTGTPLSNKVEDIWSLVDWVRPGMLGDYFTFESTYCIKNRYGGVKDYKNVAQLVKYVDSVMIRRLKKDVLKELPDKIPEKRVVELSDKEKEIYNNIKTNVLAELKAEGISTKQIKSKYVKDIRLRQAANAVQLLTSTKYPSAKLEETKTLVKEIIANEEKVLIFTQFRTMAELLAQELAEYMPLQITGAVDEETRTKNRHLFNESTTHNVMILTSAGNMGLNLQSASSVIHYDMPWSIAQLQQREDRAHRNGQKNVVTVYTLIAKDTIDEFMYELLQKKSKLSDDILNEESALFAAELSGDGIPESMIDMYVQINDNML